MKIDWQNATFEYIDSDATYNEPVEEKFSNHKNFQQLQNNFQYQPTKRSRKELEEVPIKLEVVKLEEIIFVDNDETANDDEDMIFLQNVENVEIRNVDGGSIYICTACSLDYPSIPYLRRHQTSKIHQNGLKMKERGRTLKRKKTYMRKFETVKKNKDKAVASKQNQQEFSSIADLTSEELVLLHTFDEQLRKIELENTTKDFYENFNFDLDLKINKEPVVQERRLSSQEEILEEIINYEPMLNEPAAKIQKLSCKEEILDEIVSYEPIFKGPQIIPKLSNITEQPKIKIQCLLCPKTFNLQCHYTQHMNSTHSIRNFKCQKCGKRFAEQQSLFLHLKKHLVEKPFKCSKCDRSYFNKIDLKRHEKSHEEVRDHVCKFCGKGFIRLDHLQNHLDTHERKGNVNLLIKAEIDKATGFNNDFIIKHE